jgi:hypothetical protein
VGRDRRDAGCAAARARAMIFCKPPRDGRNTMRLRHRLTGLLATSARTAATPTPPHLLHAAPADVLRARRSSAHAFGACDVTPGRVSAIRNRHASPAYQPPMCDMFPEVAASSTDPAASADDVGPTLAQAFPEATSYFSDVVAHVHGHNRSSAAEPQGEGSAALPGSPCLVRAVPSSGKKTVRFVGPTRWLPTVRSGNAPEAPKRARRQQREQRQPAISRP